MLLLLTLPVRAAEAPARAAPEPRQVTGVELRLPPGSDPSGLAQLVAVRRGQPLSIRAVRRSIERLFATGRLSDVVVRAQETPEGLNLIFELTPVRKIAGVRIEGNRVLSQSEVLAASRLSDGAEYYPERVTEAVNGVRQAYARKGYDHAAVEVERDERGVGVSLVLRVLDGPPTRIMAIDIDGQAGLRRSEVRTALRLAPGDILDHETLEAGMDRLRALYRDRGYYRAQVGDAQVEVGISGAHVVLPIVSGPRIVFLFHHNVSFPDAMLAGVLGYQGEEPLDRAVVDRLARRIETFYRYRGFANVRVGTREVSSPDGKRAAVSFEVDEGAPLRVAEVRFEGNHALPSSELRDMVAAWVAQKAPVPTGDVHPNDDPLRLQGRSLSGASRDPPDPPPGAVFVEDAYRDAADAISQRYRELGFLSAQVALREAEVDVPGRSQVVTFSVAEGPRALIASVTDAGLPEGFRAPMELAIVPGMPLNRSQLEQARANLAHALGRQGYLFAKVSADPGLSADGTRAQVRFAVESGPQVKVGQVILRGLRRTDPALVRANLAFSSGDVLDPDTLFDTQRALVLLGLFRQVAVRLIEPEAVEPTKDVVVELKERPRLFGEVGGGYSLADGPRITGSATYPNLFGRGINLSVNAKLNYVGASALALSNFSDPSDLQGIYGFDGRGNVSLHQPRIYNWLPYEVGARLDLIGERVHRPSYRFSRFAAVAGLDWTATRWLNVSAQYQIENDRVRAVSGIEQLLPTLDHTDAERLRFPVGNFTVQSIGPSVTLDFRDDPVNPSKGLLFAWTGELAHDLGATRTDSAGNPIADVPIFNFKTTANVTGYLPIAPRVVFALSLRGGRIFPLNPKSETIAPQRFFLGGALSLRGFGEDGVLPADRRADLASEVAGCRALSYPSGCTSSAQTLANGEELPSEGGELFTLGKAELRFPLYGAVDLGVFFETGNLWLSASRYDPLALRYVAGAGIRYLTPVGPLALDLGFNLQPDHVVNEPTAAVHFSVGLF